jgi:DNA-directed RNA polymerase III subunit RPC1
MCSSDKISSSDFGEILTNEFNHSSTVNTGLEASLKGTYEEFDALKVLDLFERIRDEDVPLFDMDINVCRP